MYIGAHLSIAKGLTEAVKTAREIGANTFQFFTRNPRGGKARELDEKDIARAHDLAKEYGFGPLVAHTPYIYNLSSIKPQVRGFSRQLIKDDLARVAAMKVPYLVLHVGSHGGQGEEAGLDLFIQNLSEIVAGVPEGVYIVLEAMSGEGTELGYDFTQIKTIMDGCQGNPQLGVCLDSCHLTGAGYDLARLDVVKDQIERTWGMERLKVFHLNDSRYPLGSRRDRHAILGEGQLGLDIIKSIVCDADLQKVPFILETPNDLAGYAEEIRLIKKIWGQESSD